MESGTWIVVGCVVVIVMIAYFRRIPHGRQSAATESLGKRWFG